MIKNLKKSFSIDDIDIVETENSSKYFEAEMWCLAAKNNSHHNPISEDVLRECKDTAKGAWIVCDYDQFTHDATTHTDEEQIVGVVPRDSKVELRRDKMGVLWIVVTAVLSKVYHPEVWEMFKQHNFRYVSCEFRCTEDDEDAEGNKAITSFDIVGITILGSGTLPSCEDANMKIMKFSADEANEYFAETQKKEELVSHPINKKKLDTSDWDGEKAKQDLVKEKDYDSLAKSVCLVLEDGWKDRQITSLKYPVMNIKDGEWVYNEKGLASALGYAKQHDPSLVSKIEKIQSEFNRKEDNQMADVKDAKKPTDTADDEKNKKNAADPKADEKDVKKNADDSTDPKKDDANAPKGDEPTGDDDKDKKLSDDDAKKDDKDTKDKDTKDVKASDDANDKKDDADDNKGDDTDDKKKFSLDCYADEGALLSMLEGETEENQTLCKELFAKKDLNVIMSKLLAIKKENDEFKKNAQEAEAKECSNEFSACMGEVKGDIDEKTYSELYAEGKDIKTKDEMCKFTQKVKAFAYDHKKTTDNSSKNDDVFKFSEPKKTVSDDDTDVFARLNKKYN